MHEAINDYGVGDAGSTDRLGRLPGARSRASRSRCNSRCATPSAARARLILTLITLVLGGMLFMTVGSVRLSLTSLIEQGISYNQFDINIDFEQPYRSAKIEEVLSSVPGVRDRRGLDQHHRYAHPPRRERRRPGDGHGPAGRQRHGRADAHRRPLAAARRRERHCHQPEGAGRRAGPGRG